ncbi:sugar phosphate isomerase/epimerase [Herbiconiux sp. KACC 21604]|uniref:sugar phosphate isomerase/epimerase family protein n=1 Tax=unclassified Herbiconiux TaxID=2618217 RepID=UPI001491E7D2|nr:sugar phosphate isomerase/epimerase [Herbiconiux sp. SALV-R1]QJU55235.1 sugar phosphate isomerase/epimerase [Herbiconiux sp. SALV-R1]WPO86401.1 sugar phosphate isomerase/epimerase [Herbiconiux sp. KACC 21604]
MTHRLRYACQTYSWQMSIDTWRGRVGHLVDVVAGAGFSGFEPELAMLGEPWDAATLRRELDRHHGLSLAALVVAEDWLADVETAEERSRADRAIDAAVALGARLVLVPLPGADRSDLEARRHHIMCCVRDIRDRAEARGVATTFHANSPAGSVFRTPEDYEVLAQLLPEGVGFTPDLGHLAKGGLDPLAVVRDWGDRVDHVHVKDLHADGTWAPTGEGVVDIEGVLAHLESIGFGGWVTFEDESPSAEADPDAATRRNGRWIADREASR